MFTPLGVGFFIDIEMKSASKSVFAGIVLVVFPKMKFEINVWSNDKLFKTGFVLRVGSENFNKVLKNEFDRLHLCV